MALKIFLEMTGNTATGGVFSDGGLGDDFTVPENWVEITGFSSNNQPQVGWEYNSSANTWTDPGANSDPLRISVEWIREQRDQKLADSDWTQMADSPLTDAKKTEWATYRQALRDVPATETLSTTDNPDDDDVAAMWPTEPS